MENENVWQKLLDALVQSLVQLLKFIFVLPFNLWMKSADELVKQKEKNLLDVRAVTGFWPLLTLIKRFCVDFFFYALSFLSYPVGMILSIYAFVDSSYNLYRWDVLTALEVGFEAYLGVLICTYYFPVIMSLTHDFFQLMILPVRKWISYFSKPAQQLDLDIKNR